MVTECLKVYIGLGEKRKTKKYFQVWWHTTLILALGRQRQVDLCEFLDSLVYRVRSRAAKENRELLSENIYTKK